MRYAIEDLTECLKESGEYEHRQDRFRVNKVVKEHEGGEVVARSLCMTFTKEQAEYIKSRLELADSIEEQ